MIMSDSIESPPVKVDIKKLSRINIIIAGRIRKCGLCGDIDETVYLIINELNKLSQK